MEKEGEREEEKRGRRRNRDERKEEVNEGRGRKREGRGKEAGGRKKRYKKRHDSLVEMNCLNKSVEIIFLYLQNQLLKQKLVDVTLASKQKFQEQVRV